MKIRCQTMLQALPNFFFMLTFQTQFECDPLTSVFTRGRCNRTSFAKSNIEEKKVLNTQCLKISQEVSFHDLYRVSQQVLDEKV